MSLEKLANEIRQLCEAEKYGQLIEFLEKSKDFHHKARDNADAMLALFDHSKHTFGYLSVLKYKILIPIKQPEHYIKEMTKFSECFNVDQARRVSDGFCGAFHVLTQLVLEKGTPQKGIVPLIRAITRFRESPSHLTSIHGDLCCLCLASRNLKIALKFLEENITNLNNEGNTFDSRGLLQYFYYGGYVYTALKNYSKAIYFFEVCLTTPSIGISQIQVESYKKYVLISLLTKEEVPKLPKYCSHVIQRYIKNLTGPYGEFATAYLSKDNVQFEVEKAVKNYGDVFKNDQNFGLIKLCIANLTKRSIQRLTKTFVTLSLSDLADRVGLQGGPAEAEKYIFSMTEAGEISATIDQPKGMISFKDDIIQDNEVIIQLEKQLDECIQLGETLRSMNMDLSKNPIYLRRTATSTPQIDDPSLKEILSV